MNEPLWEAIVRGADADVRVALCGGADCTQRDDRGRTAIAASIRGACVSRDLILPDQIS